MSVAMARAKEPQPARLVVSVIYATMDALADSLKALERRFGRVQYETSEIPCAAAECYREEMGDGLQRRFFSFERMLARTALSEAKTACSKIEPQFADRTGDYLFRAVNIDPGIITPENLVMASHREEAHRVYLRDGVFAEVTLIRTSTGYARLPWTNPDFCHDEAVDFLDRVHASFELIEQPV